MTNDDEYRGVGLVSRMGGAGAMRAIAYIAVLGMLVPIVIGAIAVLR